MNQHYAILLANLKSAEILRAVHERLKIVDQEITVRDCQLGRYCYVVDLDACIIVAFIRTGWVHISHSLTDFVNDPKQVKVDSCQSPVKRRTKMPSVIIRPKSR